MAARIPFSALGLLLLLAGCPSPPTPAWAEPREPAPNQASADPYVAAADAGGTDGEAHGARVSAGPPPAAAAAPCSDALPSGVLARLSCAGDRILLASPVELHPRREVPLEPTRSVLSAVGALMREHREVQLIRIEGYSNAEVGADPRRARVEVEQSQRRADAVLRYLWLREKVSAERMEAVGYGATGRTAGAPERWPIVLVVVQRRAP